MFTTIGLAIIVAAAAALAVSAAWLPAAWRPVHWSVHLVARALKAGARFASRGADGLLARRDGDVSPPRVMLFAAVAGLPLAAALAAPAVPRVSEWIDPGGLLAVGLVFLLLVLLAAAFIVREDYDAMDGLVAEGKRRFRGPRAAAHPAVVVTATALVVAYLAAGAWWLMAVHGVPLVAHAPSAVPAPLSFLLIALRALPSDPLLSLLDRLTGDDTHVVIGPGFVPGAYFLSVRIIGIGIALGVIVIAVEHARQVRRFLTEIEASDAYRPELIARGQRAPRAIERGILSAATTPSRRDQRQQRFIAAAVEIGLCKFPALFCTRLAAFGPAIRDIGLDRSIEMFRYRTREFDAEESLALFAAASGAFVAGALDLEPTKKLTRLMASVVIFKKEQLKIPAGLKARVMDALKIELAKPRASEDAALRGILRDLQAALGGEPIVIKPILPSDRDRDGWVKPASPALADRVARPEIPSTTVH